MYGSKFFTTLDPKYCYKKKKVYYLTTFFISKGNHRLPRFLCGLKWQLDVFSLIAIVVMFEDLQGVETYIDGILVYVHMLGQ